jgi:hypothetical protein
LSIPKQTKNFLETGFSGARNHSAGAGLVSRSRHLAGHSVAGGHPFDVDGYRLSAESGFALALVRAKITDPLIGPQLSTLLA